MPRVFRSGNSLSVRIPGGIAERLELSEGTEIQMSIDRGALRIEKTERQPTIDELLAGITPENLHEEQITTTVGREVWEWEP